MEPQGADSASRGPGPRRRELLLTDLARRVAVPWLQRRLFADEIGDEGISAHGTRRLEPAALELSRATRARPHVTVAVAPARPFAVDDHRAGQHEPAHPGPRHRGEHDGGAGHVDVCVVGKVVHVDAEADLRCQVADGIDTGKRMLHRRGVTHVADHMIDIGRGFAEIEHPHLMTCGDEPLAHR